MVMAVMANVVVLNFAYDVPVKLFSIHLLVMATFVVAPSIKRLSDFFLFNKIVEPEVSQAFYRNAKNKWYYRVAKSITVIIFLVPALT